MIRERGSAPPAIMISALPYLIWSAANPMAVAPEEQAVIKVVFGPKRPRLDAMWSADDAQKSDASREKRVLSFPFFRYDS